MLRIIRFSGFLAVLFVMACNRPAVKELSLENPAGQARRDELIVLNKAFLEKQLGAIPEGKFITVTGKDQKPLTVQFDDTNGDEVWDQAAFLYSFQPKEKVTLQVAVADQPAAGTDTTRRAHVRLRKKNPDDSFGPVITRETMPVRNPATDFAKQPLPLYLTEGPAWENDKVAFRLYFDVRNGKDIFGKTTPAMVMDEVGARTNNSYHELSDWGMDILHVGTSLGAGALALRVPLAGGGDTLVRLGGQQVKKETYEEVADGPVRAVFRMHYDWEINGRPVTVTDETSIWGGQYFYQSKVTVTGAPDSSQLVAGVANFYDNKEDQFEQDSAAVLFTSGPQSENKDFLNMGIMVGKQHFAGFGTTPAAGPGITNTYTVAQNLTDGQPLSYRFYVGWEKTDPQFKSAAFFRSMLSREATCFSQPVQINWQ